jgi:hypothetical protein
MWAKLWTVGPQQYIPTVVESAGRNSSTARVSVLNNFTDILKLPKLRENPGNKSAKQC